MQIEIGFYSIVCLLILLAFRIPVAIALIGVSIGGISAILNFDVALSMLTSKPYEFLSKWTLSAVPMFLMMGFVCYHSGLTAGLFSFAKICFRWLPGGLAISSIFASSGFAAVSGSSVACAAAMGKIAIPEMVRSGYKPSFACGTIAAGGTIGALIPPSILMIVYGTFTQTSISNIFLGGVVIGLLTALAYSLIVLLVSLLRPDIVPRHEEGSFDYKITQALQDVWPVLVLGLIVFGGMFSGFFTATEAGAVGAGGSILIAFILRRLSFKTFKNSIVETLCTTSSLLIIGVGASMFTVLLSLSGVSVYFSNLLATWDLSYFELMLIIILIYLVLGLFMEPFGAMLITLPVFLPVLIDFDISLVWFGVLVVKLLEIGMITPPVGMNIFVIRGVAAEYATLVDIFRGVKFFLLADLLIVALMIIAPSYVMLLTD
jgi:tripartite ATP-independent transporter DctM subunit